MNALVFTSNGVRRGIISSALTNFENLQPKLNVSIVGADNVTESFVPSNVYTAETMIDAENLAKYPFLLVSRKDHKMIAKLAPRTRKVREKKSA